jgi:hypothetical protein
VCVCVRGGGGGTLGSRVPIEHIVVSCDSLHASARVCVSCKYLSTSRYMSQAIRLDPHNPATAAVLELLQGGPVGPGGAGETASKQEPGQQEPASQRGNGEKRIMYHLWHVGFLHRARHAL